MVINPARVAQIGNLDANDLEVEAYIFGLALLTSRGCRGIGGFVERNAGNVLREKISRISVLSVDVSSYLTVL